MNTRSQCSGDGWTPSGSLPETTWPAQYSTRRTTLAAAPRSRRRIQCQPAVAAPPRASRGLLQAYRSRIRSRTPLVIGSSCATTMSGAASPGRVASGDGNVTDLCVDEFPEATGNARRMRHVSSRLRARLARSDRSSTSAFRGQSRTGRIGEIRQAVFGLTGHRGSAQGSCCSSGCSWPKTRSVADPT
jgi:hypothetical protein